MKTRLVEERIGERVGDVDWNYDFYSHKLNPDVVQSKINDLKRIEANIGHNVDVYVRIHSNYLPVVDVAMWDGWPYWRPVPSVCVRTWAGIEWHSFDMISGSIVKAKEVVS